MPTSSTEDTCTITIDLGAALHPDLASEVEKQSIYIDTALLSLKVSESRSQVEFSTARGREQEVGARVQRFLDAIRRGHREVPMRILGVHARRCTRPFETAVFEQLVALGWVLDLGPGQAALAGPALALAQRLDGHIVAAAHSLFGATERAYPALIPADVLARCGYTSSFPQHLCIVTHLDENYDAIERFRRDNEGRSALAIPEPAAFGSPKVCLCPALCYHCYPTLQGRCLPPQGHVETASGRIARYESTSMRGLDRLWEFSQRSIIWLGDDALCTALRERAIQLALKLAADWDLDAHVETASDPFFSSVATAKSFWQRGQDLKFELRAAVEAGVGDAPPRTVAAGSFNLHGTYFGSAFDITDHHGGPAFSGCASWGIERLVLAVCTQHGLTPADWPAALRPAD